MPAKPNKIPAPILPFNVDVEKKSHISKRGIITRVAKAVGVADGISPITTNAKASGSASVLLLKSLMPAQYAMIPESSVTNNGK